MELVEAPQEIALWEMNAELGIIYPPRLHRQNAEVPLAPTPAPATQPREARPQVGGAAPVPFSLDLAGGATDTAAPAAAAAAVQRTPLLDIAPGHPGATRPPHMRHSTQNATQLYVCIHLFSLCHTGINCELARQREHIAACRMQRWVRGAVNSCMMSRDA